MQKDKRQIKPYIKQNNNEHNKYKIRRTKQYDEVLYK